MVVLRCCDVGEPDFYGDVLVLFLFVDFGVVYSPLVVVDPGEDALEGVDFVDVGLGEEFVGLVHVLFHAVLLFGECSEVLEIVLFLFVECINVKLFFVGTEVAKTILFVVFNCIRPEILLDV